jgi:hypothetical protein
MNTHTGRYLHQSFSNYGLFSSTTEVRIFGVSIPCNRNCTVFLSPLDILKFALGFVIGDLDSLRKQ